MVLHQHRALALLLLSLSPRALVSMRRCGREFCRDEQRCCPRGGNGSAVVCCQRPVGDTYYSIAIVTRKLSGVLILLLLFALGYWLHRLLCSKAGRLVQAQDARPPVTTSQDPLVGSSSPDPAPAPAPAPDAHLPSYHGPKRLPTYEETMREERGAAGAACTTRASV